MSAGVRFTTSFVCVTKNPSQQIAIGKWTSGCSATSKPMSIQPADQRRGLALGRDRVGHHQIHAGPPDRFLDDLAPGKKRRDARCLKKQVIGISIRLPLLILGADD